MIRTQWCAPSGALLLNILLTAGWVTPRMRASASWVPAKAIARLSAGQDGPYWPESSRFIILQFYNLGYFTVN